MTALPTCLPRPLLLGVDGGGSKTSVLLGTVDGAGDILVLGRGVAGPSNLRAVGKDLALANLEKGISEAIQKANLGSNLGSNLEGQSIDYAVLALAGSSLPDIKSEVSHWAKHRHLARQFEVVHDLDPVLAAGTTDGWGIALIAGTGAVARGVNQSGDSLTIGGWGHWFADRGSGYDLGRNALWAVAEAVDQTGPKTLLVELILDKLKLSEAREIVPTISQGANIQRQIASLAPLVIYAAEMNDRVALSIIDAATEEATKLISQLAKRLEITECFSLVVAGGLACTELYRTTLIAHLQSAGLRHQPLVTVDEPVIGSLKIARAQWVSQP